MFDETQASDSQPDFTAVMATTAIGNRGESTVGAGRAIAPQSFYFYENFWKLKFLLSCLHKWHEGWSLFTQLVNQFTQA